MTKTITSTCVDVTIAVTFTAVGSGSQNITIGYRVQGSGASYTTTQAVVVGGIQQTTSITVPCPGQCDGVVYEGYIANDCDPQNQIPWTALVVDPDYPDCYEYEWTCDNVGIGLIQSTGGSGYQVGDTVTFSGGGGSGAQAIVAGLVQGTTAPSSFTITNPGQGYTSAPAVNILSTNGQGASVTAFLANCPDLTHLHCLGGDTVPVIMSLELGESYIECGTTAGYAAKVQTLTDAGDIGYFVHEGTGVNCSCADCDRVTVTNTNPTKGITIFYQTCDDDSVPSQGGELLNVNINAGATWTSDCKVICSTVTTQTTDDFTIDSCDDC